MTINYITRLQSSFGERIFRCEFGVEAYWWSEVNKLTLLPPFFFDVVEAFVRWFDCLLFLNDTASMFFRHMISTSTKHRNVRAKNTSFHTKCFVFHKYSAKLNFLPSNWIIYRLTVTTTIQSNHGECEKFMHKSIHEHTVNVDRHTVACSTNTKQQQQLWNPIRQKFLHINVFISV